MTTPGLKRTDPREADAADGADGGGAAGRVTTRSLPQELARLALLALVAWWLGGPLLNRALIGGGDTVWYHHQVADAVTQFRLGEWPVLVGQTHYAYNGAVHPIRTAPALPYLCGLLDLLTGRSRSFAELLNLAAFTSVAAGLLVTYLALAWLEPTRRGWAVAGALLYVGSPAVLGLPYAQDLYMSTMAIPWVPLAFAATLRVVRDERDTFAAVVWGAALGLLWWAHSPIAFWTTAAVGAVGVVHALGRWRAGKTAVRAGLRQAAWGGGSLALLAAYPIASVLALRPPGEAIVPRLANREHLLQEIERAFPHLLQPLDPAGSLLTFMQPGYAALLALGVAAVAARRVGDAGARRAIWTLVALAVGYLVMVLPVPGVTGPLWRNLPELAVSMTNIWPMQRLSAIIAAIAVVGLQAARPGAGAGGGRIRGGAIVMAAAVGLWAASEAQTVRAVGQARTRSVEETRVVAREDNANLSEIAYQQLPYRPDTFIHGVTDPQMELRLLHPATGQVVASNKAAVEDAAAEPWVALRPAKGGGAGLVRFEPTFTLRPGERYLLTFRFGRAELRGTLRLTGSVGLQRVYVLPAAGDAAGFGTGAGQEKSLSVWTTAEANETLTLEFIPENGRAAEVSGAAFGDVRLTAIEPARLPVEVVALVPLTLTVRSPEPARVETVRVWIPGWQAEVNGQAVPVERSAQGLATIAVPAGESRVVLRYPGPAGLRAIFWLSLAGMVGVSGAIGWQAGLDWRRARREAVGPVTT